MKMCRCIWKHWSMHSHNLLSVCSNTDRQHWEFKLTVCSSFAFYINSIKMTNLQNLKVVIVRKCVQTPRNCVESYDWCCCTYRVRWTVTIDEDRSYPSLVKRLTVRLALPPGTGAAPLIYTCKTKNCLFLHSHRESTSFPNAAKTNII